MRLPHRHSELNEGRGNSAAIPALALGSERGYHDDLDRRQSPCHLGRPDRYQPRILQTKKPFVGRLPTKGLGGYKTLLYRNERSSAWLSVTRKTCTDSLSIQIGFLTKVGPIIIRN